MLGLLLSMSLVVGPKMIGADIAFDANPVVLVAKPPDGQSVHLTSLACSATDGVDNTTNVVTLNDIKATTLTLALDATQRTRADYSPPLTFPAGEAATFKVSQPSVVQCFAYGTIGP